MSPDLSAKIRKARFRLGCDLFLRRLVVCLTVAFLAGAAIEFAKRWIAIPVPVEILGLVGLGIGFVAAGVWTFLAAPTRADAAAAIDHHFGLKERITTLLSLPADMQETPAAVALRDDVESRVKDLTIEEKLGIAAPRHGWLPVVPLALLVAAAFFAPQATSPRAEAKSVKEADRKKAIEQTENLVKKLEQKQKEATKEQGVANEQMKELTQKVTDLAKEMAKDGKANPQDTALKLSDLAKTLDQKRKQFDALDKLKASLSKLPSGKDSPIDKISQSLKQGDFKEAAKRLDELKKKLQDGNMSKNDRQALAQQMQQLQQKLRDIGNMAKREEELRKAISDPKQLAKELAKLAQDAKKLEQLKQLASQMQRAAEKMSKDPPTSADKAEMAKSLDQAKEMLEQLSKDEATREMMDRMAGDLEDARQAMMSDRPDAKMDEPRQGPGGQGQGYGARPEAPDETKGRLSKAPTKEGKGKAFAVGFGEGKNFRGDSKLEIKAMATRAAATADEAVTRQKVPPEYKKHTQQYFEQLNKGLGN